MIHRYTLEEKLGNGNFGEVYSGTLKVAIKRIPKKIIEQQNIYEELEREKEILSKCQSNNIIKLFDFIETENYYDLILEKCDTDLNSILEKKHRGFTMIEIRNIMNQLNNGFKIMQLHNIIHRDIKLENIFVKYNNQSKNDFIVKLGDFGLSREFPNEKIDDSFCGSPETMAPEIYDEKPYNNKVDLYSIGIIMYQMYYNHFPNFNDNDIPDKLPNDNNFKDLLIKCLKKNPNERISWKNYFHHEFFLDMKHINILVMGKKNCGKSTLIKNIFKDKEYRVNNTILAFSNCVISEGKNEKFRFYEMKGFNERRYKFENMIQDVNSIINNELDKKDPDKFIHCIWYCFNHQTFNMEEYKYIKQLINNFRGEKIPICFVSTITIDKNEASNIFDKLMEFENKKNEIYVKCRLLAEKFVVNDKKGKFITTINPFGIDFLIKSTIQKLKDISQEKNINYLPLDTERNRNRYSFTNILERIKVEC
jgi:serine/threonine protein kinase